MSAGWKAQINNQRLFASSASIAFAKSPGRTAYCYAELDVSSPAVVETIASSHCPERDE